MRKSTRGKEVRLNDLGYRMAWLQSRVFAGRTVFLQRACELLTVPLFLITSKLTVHSGLLPQQNSSCH
jgi:hypothetical protein